MKTANSQAYKQSSVALLTIITGIYSISSSLYYFYGYHFTDKLWFYIIPNYKLAFDAILGLWGLFAGWQLFKNRLSAWTGLLTLAFIFIYWTVIVHYLS